KSDQPLAKALPQMFEMLNVEIEEMPVDEVLEPIGERLKRPVLYDRNAIALHSLDLSKKVSMPGKKSSYSQILRKVLFQAGLQFELRHDEAGQKFLWITSVKPS